MTENQTQKVKKVRSTIPTYIAAAAFVLYGLLFPLYRVKHILLGLLVMGLVWLISLAWFPKKVVVVEEPPKPVSTGDTEVDAIIGDGRIQMQKLKALNDAIRDEYISLEISRMEKSGKLILDTIEAHPERAGKVRRFLSYYLPTTRKLLESYRTLSNHQVVGENIRATLDSIKSSMDMIATAFEKQADSLFADENMDISTDIEVLESVLQSEGLKEPQ